jgi:integrase
VWDRDLKGFGLRVEVSGTKTFLVRYRAAGRKRLATVGRYGELAPEQARRLAQNLLADVRGGNDPTSERRKERQALTVRELADRFLDEHVEVKRKKSTAAHYASLIDRYLLPKHGSRKAHDLSRADLARLHLSLRDKPYQANRLLAVVASMYSFGDKIGLVPEGCTPATKISRFAEARRERFLSTAELGRLGEAFRLLETEGRFSEGVAALRLLLFTGARLREILHLQWENVDLERGLLLLPDSKTGRKTITLNAAAMEVLQSLDRVGAFVIPGSNWDSPRADLKKPWVAVTEMARLEGLRIHDLRHSFASIGAGAGLGLLIVGKLLGHTQAATTQRYAHLDADPVRRAADVIGATLTAALQGGAKTQGNEGSGSGAGDALNPQAE